MSDDQIQKCFGLKKEQQIKISSLLNASNDNRKPEEFSIRDIKVFVDSEEQNWFKQAHVGKCLGLKHIDMSVEGLDKCEMPARNYIKAAPHGTGVGLDPSIIKTRRINSSQSLGSCMSL